jgi:hypothetical protein
MNSMSQLKGASAVRFVCQRTEETKKKKKPAEMLVFGLGVM